MTPGHRRLSERSIFSDSEEELFNRNRNSSQSKGCCSLTNICYAVGIILGVLFAVAVAVVIVHHVNKGKETDGKTGDHKELHCFECMVLTNGTGGDTDLPYEAHCETKPKKSRKCAEDELCYAGSVFQGNKEKFVRQCVNAKKVGCFTTNKPFRSEFCICDSSFCLK